MTHLAHERHLRARIQAYPFGLGFPFEQRLIELPRSLVEHSSSDTLGIGGALERSIGNIAGSVSLDVLRQLRRAIWFREAADGVPGKAVPLDAYLHRLVQQYLHDNGNQIGLKSYSAVPIDAEAERTGDSASNRAQSVRWLTLMLPADLLIAALCRGTRPPVEYISLVSPSLTRLLEKGIAETHLHVGAALSFHELWTNLMGSIGATDVLEELVKDKEPSTPFGGGRHFGLMLLSAAVLRLVLAEYLKCQRDVAFDSLLRVWRSKQATLVAALELAFGAAGGDLSLPRVQQQYRKLVGVRRERRGYDGLRNRDPLSDLFGDEELQPETGLLSACFARLKAPKCDRRFAEAFWQYQRIRIAAYQYLTHRPGSAGLDWFERHYRRIKSLRGEMGRHCYASALRLDSRSGVLQSIEMRTAPGEDWHKIRDMARAVADAAVKFIPARNASPPECGLVLHFVKTSEPGLVSLPRHSGWFRKSNRAATSIVTAMKFCPELLLVLRGLDVASAELALPNWVVAPLIRRVRHASEVAAAALRRAHRGWDIPALAVTLHVGEEYRRLHEGLRRVHEALELGLLRRGDRIGHGLALGERPDRSANGLGRVPQPCEERLEDLLWELQRYRNGDFRPTSGRELRVAAEVERLGHLIYGDDVNLEVLLMARRARFQVEDWGYPGFYPMDEGNEKRIDAAHGWFTRRARQVYRRYLEDSEVARRGAIPVEIARDCDEVDMLKAAQAYVRRELALREITVETNPSSNLLIGCLEDINCHPAFILSPVKGVDGEQIPISINVDDPITFATCLSDEFAYMYYALIGHGIGTEAAMQWLDRARENAIRTRFTQPISASKDALRDILSPRAQLF